MGKPNVVVRFYPLTPSDPVRPTRILGVEDRRPRQGRLARLQLLDLGARRLRLGGRRRDALLVGFSRTTPRSLPDIALLARSFVASHGGVQLTSGHW